MALLLMIPECIEGIDVNDANDRYSLKVSDLTIETPTLLYQYKAGVSACKD